MEVVPAHRVNGVGLFIDDVLVIKEKLISFQQLLLLYHQLISSNVVFHYLRKLEVVVANSLTPEDDHRLLIEHVQSH